MFIWLFSIGAAASPEPLPPFPTRRDVVEDWLRADPGVRGAGLEVLASRSAADGAAPLAPLMVEAGVAPLMMHSVGVEVAASWMLPAPRMRAALTGLAEAQVTERQATARMTRAEVAADASQTVDEVWELASIRAILDHQEAVLTAAAEAVGRRVGAGLATPEMRVMADMARVELAEERLRIDRRASVVHARLSLLDDRQPSLLALMAWAHASAAPPPPDPVLSTRADWIPAAEMARAELEMARQMEAMARRAGAPMTELMLSYSSMWAEPEMGLMVGAGVEVPLDARALRQKLRAAELSTRAAESRVLTTQTRILNETAAAAAMVEEASQMEILMRERMLPLTAERVRLARIAFETNRGTLADLLAAERDDAHAAQRLVQSTAERHRAEAMLAMALGQLAGTETEIE